MARCTGTRSQKILSLQPSASPASPACLTSLISFTSRIIFTSFIIFIISISTPSTSSSPNAAGQGGNFRWVWGQVKKNSSIISAFAQFSFVVRVEAGGTGTCAMAWWQSRHKKTTRERREQRLRAEGRTASRLLRAFQEVQGHRGGQPHWLACRTPSSRSFPSTSSSIPSINSMNFIITKRSGSRWQLPIGQGVKSKKTAPSYQLLPSSHLLCGSKQVVLVPLRLHGGKAAIRRRRGSVVNSAFAPKGAQPFGS